MRAKPKLSDDLLNEVSALGPGKPKAPEEETSQSRTLPMPLRADDLDRIDEPTALKQGK